MDNRYQRGIEIVTKLAGEQGKGALEELGVFSPDFASKIIEFGFGEIYSRPVLDLKQRELLTLASLITQGAESQLQFHFRSSLHIGLTKEEIMEVILHCALYAGFPRALSALQVFQGIIAVEGR